MEVQASLNGFRVSAFKARLVANQVRGKGVEEALTILSLSTKKSASAIVKLLRSAVANAENRNDESGAGNEGGLFRGQEEDGSGDLRRFAEATHGDVDEPALSLLLGVQVFHQQFRAQRSRTEGIYTDIFAGVNNGQLAAQGEDSPFAGGVGDLGGGSSEHGHERGGVDNGPAPRPQQRRDAVLASQKDALEIDVHGQIPHRFLRLHGVAVVDVRDAGVIEEHVKAAECPLRHFHHPRAVGGARHVGGHGGGPAALLLDQPRRLLRAGRDDVDGRHRCPLPGKQEGGLPTDAAAGPGHEGRFTL